MNGFDIDEALSEEIDEEIGASGGADSEGGATKPFETKPPFADEGTGIMAGFGIHPPKNLQDQLVGKTRVDPIMATHQELCGFIRSG